MRIFFQKGMKYFNHFSYFSEEIPQQGEYCDTCRNLFFGNYGAKCMCRISEEHSLRQLAPGNFHFKLHIFRFTVGIGPIISKLARGTYSWVLNFSVVFSRGSIPILSVLCLDQVVISF